MSDNAADLMAWTEADAAKNSAGCHAVAIAALRERLEASRVVIGDCTLYCEDCEFVLPTLCGYQALVTDWPYGIGENGSKCERRGRLRCDRNFSDTEWRDDPISPELFKMVTRIGKYKIIFGGNYYAMPAATCWLVWDKLNSGDFADCELAWTNLDMAVRRIQYRWNGAVRQNNEPRGDHPTQKPVGVMRWCIGHLPADARTILDPFMGSGTTGVACVQMGRKFIGIERERRYFDAACRRIQEAYAQPRLDLPEPPRATAEQTQLFD